MKDENETKKKAIRLDKQLVQILLLFKLESNYSEKIPVSTDVLNEKGDEFLSTVSEALKTELRKKFQKTLLTFFIHYDCCKQRIMKKLQLKSMTQSFDHSMKVHTLTMDKLKKKVV